MRCNVCGRQIQNEEANFCEYCGSSFRERMQNSFHMNPNGQGNPYGDGPIQKGPISNGMPIGMQEQERPVSFLDWLFSYGILFIPFVGLLVYIVMLFVWAFSSYTAPSKKNWARATLIFVAVVIMIYMVVLIFMVSASPEFRTMFQQMQNGTFDTNSLNMK